HPALENVEHDVEIDVDVGAGDTARRNGGHVHRQLGRGHVLGGQAGLVLDAVPTPAGAAAADDEHAVAPFDRGFQIAVRFKHGSASSFGSVIFPEVVSCFPV